MARRDSGPLKTLFRGWKLLPSTGGSSDCTTHVVSVPALYDLRDGCRVSIARRLGCIITGQSRLHTAYAVGPETTCQKSKGEEIRKIIEHA